MKKFVFFFARKEALFCFRRWHDNECWHLRSRVNVTMDGVCLRQRGISWSLEHCFVAVDEICCHEIFVGGTTEVQLSDLCSPYTITEVTRLQTRHIKSWFSRYTIILFNISAMFMCIIIHSTDGKPLKATNDFRSIQHAFVYWLTFFCMAHEPHALYLGLDDACTSRRRRSTGWNLVRTPRRVIDDGRSKAVLTRIADMLRCAADTVAPVENICGRW